MFVIVMIIEYSPFWLLAFTIRIEEDTWIHGNRDWCMSYWTGIVRSIVCTIAKGPPVVCIVSAALRPGRHPTAKNSARCLHIADRCTCTTCIQRTHPQRKVSFLYRTLCALFVVTWYLVPCDPTVRSSTQSDGKSRYQLVVDDV